MNMHDRPIAALYVDTQRGPYPQIPGVECWDRARDARLYDGPHPVVAHPPCERWGNFWRGGLRAGKPSASGGTIPTYRLGDDGGCFERALWAVRTFGGVLEHPAQSRAWQWYGLCAPGPSGWTCADWSGGWTCRVEQGHYGHPARKPTWLYACRTVLPSLEWGPSGATMLCSSARNSRERYDTEQRRTIPEGLRHVTPPEFARILVEIARSVKENGQ